MTESAPEERGAVGPGEARVPVPRVVQLRGMRPAVGALEAAGFAVKVNDMACGDSGDAGLPLIDVQGTQPAAGTLVRAGRTVTLKGYSVLADLYGGCSTEQGSE